MIRASSKVLATLVLVSLVTSDASAQFGTFIGPGSTPQGDIARGQGVFLGGAGAYLVGAGLYNYYTATADSIYTDTWMRLNEYIYQSARIAAMRHEKRLREKIARDKAHHKAILDRIRNNPEDYDLARGDALNALFEELANPQLNSSSYRLYPVRLSGDTIRTIPFFYGPRDKTISMQRLSTRGRWPVGLRGPDFSGACRAYERALDTALEQQIEGKLSTEAIAAVGRAIDDLEALVQRRNATTSDRDTAYVEAMNFVRSLKETKELLKFNDVEKIVAEIEKYSGTTVEDLIAFMKKFNLRFGVPTIGDERGLYPELYASLEQQVDLLRIREDDPKR